MGRYVKIDWNFKFPSLKIRKLNILYVKIFNVTNDHEQQKMYKKDN